ncbi:MAG: fibrobacter succinogenes major paralogous domain-containing protein [Saprospiraceae bacterium]|jgi:uncharacterized protein (TIGR02145 family)
MTIRILLFTMLPILCIAQVSPKEDILSNNNPSIERGNLTTKRNAMYNLEEIKVRWKKAALENCSGVPCVVAPSFTCGTSTVSDFDGNAYNTVAIGTQCWTTTNLKVTKYNDGTDIPLDASGGPLGNGSGETWSGLSTGARTVIDNNNVNIGTYGYLYNWFTVSDSRGLCPNGWHVSTSSDWFKLAKSIDPGADTLFASYIVSTTAGEKLKSTGNWLSNNGTDNYGFSGQPGGYRYDDGDFTYSSRLESAIFWSSTLRLGSSIQFYLSDFNAGKNNLSSVTDNPKIGCSIRCVKN